MKQASEFGPMEKPDGQTKQIFDTENCTLKSFNIFNPTGDGKYCTFRFKAKQWSTQMFCNIIFKMTCDT